LGKKTYREDSVTSGQALNSKANPGVSRWGRVEKKGW